MADLTVRMTFTIPNAAGQEDLDEHSAESFAKALIALVDIADVWDEESIKIEKAWLETEEQK